MPEINHEVNIAPGDVVNQQVFATGIHFCVTLDELKAHPGEDFVRSYRLPLHERRLFDDDAETSQNERPYAENRTVMMVGVTGQTVSVIESTDILSGKEQRYTVTPEGWIVPPGLAEDERPSSADISRDLIVGYFSPKVSLLDVEEGALVERKPIEKPALQQLYAEPPSEEEQNRYYG